MNIEDKAYNIIIARCNSILKPFGYLDSSFCYWHNSSHQYPYLALSCKFKRERQCNEINESDVFESEVFVVLAAHSDGYFYHLENDKCSNDINAKDIVEGLMQTLENEKFIEISIDVPGKFLKDTVFLHKHDTLESLAIEYDMRCNA